MGAAYSPTGAEIPQPRQNVWTCRVGVVCMYDNSYLKIDLPPAPIFLVKLLIAVS